MAQNSYACYKITAAANENVIPKIFEAYSGNVPRPEYCKVKFIGFEADEGTRIKINNLPNIVPSTERFITPFEDEHNHMEITQLSFDEGCSALNIWVIF